MLAPSPVGLDLPFYAVGNTPAASLTRCLPHGVDADILCLGSGDVRHILYTAYAERCLPPRKLDVTCCDSQDHVIARNVLLLSLLLDRSRAVSTDVLWNIYYHWFLSASDLAIVGQQAEKLVAVAGSSREWHASVYGRRLRFCDQESLFSVRKIWQEYAAGVASKGDPGYNNTFQSRLQKSRATATASFGGRVPILYTGTRALAPLALQLTRELHLANEAFWAKGFFGESPPDPLAPNPLFAAALSDDLYLSFPTNPLLSFHLATAGLDLTNVSPLRLESPSSSSGEARLLEAAKIQFREWIAAFRDLADNITLRFTTAECFAVCQTLRYNGDAQHTSANWYRRQLDLRPFVLDDVDYGSHGSAPRRFDVVDTSNMADYYGAVNLLVSAKPLLKDLPSSTLYTEIMTRGSESEQSKFESLLAGHTRAVSALLGLSPIEYWTNATAVSSVDEYLVSLSAQHDGKGGEGPRIQWRFAWKLDHHLSPHGPVTVDPQSLAVLAWKVYQDMFSHENLDLLQRAAGRDLDQWVAATSYPKHHRGSFASLASALCRKTGCDGSVFGARLMELVIQDTTLSLGSNHIQELAHLLSQHGIYSDRWLSQHIRRDIQHAAPFCRWREIPETVAVTLAIPAEKWMPVLSKARDHALALNMEAHFQSTNPGPGGWHNIYSDVHLTCGTVSSRGSRDDDAYAVVVQQDPGLLAGSSSMIATFYVPTATLQVNIPSTTVSLCLQSTVQNVRFFQADLGSPMAVYKTLLTDEEHVFITKCAPHQSGYPVLGGGSPGAPGLSALTLEEPCDSKATVDIDRGTGDIATITGRLDITSKEGQELLQAKVPIELRQQQSPFVIEIVFGKKQLVLPLHFPVPVLRAGSKSRIARKSCYIEIIAPLAEPSVSGVLDDFIFPSALLKPPSTAQTVPAALNVPNVNLDTLPILNVDNKSGTRFLTTLTSFMFSARERRLREQVAESSRSGISEASARLNFKESLFTMFMLSSGLQGGQTGLFAIMHPQRGGIHMLVFVSALRLDGAGTGVVLDAAVLPFTTEMIANAASSPLYEFLLLLRTLECCSVTVNDAELALWKRLLPALAERCRTWSHGTDCEYAAAHNPNATAPLSLEPGARVLCSCGEGKLPPDFVALPEWDVAARYATRVAISPVYAVPFVEEVVDPVLAGQLRDPEAARAAAEQERCRCCGRTEARGGGPLKKCMRCLAVKYCSGECQKKDWKKHRMECEEADVYANE